jgi:hypothetical protein
LLEEIRAFFRGRVDSADAKHTHRERLKHNRVSSDALGADYSNPPSIFLGTAHTQVTHPHHPKQAVPRQRRSGILSEPDIDALAGLDAGVFYV